MTASAGIVRRPRHPAGWIPPGPPPAGPGDRSDAWPAADEDLCFICGQWRIFQKQRGHRFSLDDVATAWFAAEACAGRDIRSALDVGCGSGSVLLMIAWRLPRARVLGIEAQEVSAGLARRSIAWNGVAHRCEVRDGDLRDGALVPEGASFDLVTGTPPYIPVGRGVMSERVQRGPACFEVRGGIEDYAAAAARALAPDGLFAVCHSDPERTHRAAEQAGLTVLAERAVVPREGRAPLFSLFLMARAGAREEAGGMGSPLVVRDAAGQWTEEFRAARRSMGMPS